MGAPNSSTTKTTVLEREWSITGKVLGNTK